MTEVSELLAAGKRHHRAGRLDEADALYQQVLAQDPACGPALGYLGAIELERKRFEQAVQLLASAAAIEPANYQVLANLALAHWRQGDLSAAITANERALAINPGLVPALGNLGLIYRQQGQLEKAEPHLRRAAEIEPNQPQPLFHLATVLADLGRNEEAVACYQRVLALNPQHAESYNNLASVFKKLDRRPEAEQNYRAALRLVPDHPLALSNLGSLLSDRGEYEQAIGLFRRAQSLRPQLPEIATNMGYTLVRMGELAEAHQQLARALALNPQSAAAHMNLATAHLVAGDYPPGFKENEWRLNSGYVCAFRPRTTVWEGSPAAGDSILLMTEQGAGDSFQFLRFARELHTRGWRRVYVECLPHLQAIVSCFDGVDGTITPGDEPIEIDYCIPLLSVPYRLETTAHTIPNQVPYLTIEPARIEAWRERLGANSGLRVGIVWQGNPRCNGDPLRSIPLAEFAPLASVPGVQFVSLQVGFGAEQLAPLRDRFPVVELDDSVDREAGAFMDTAAIMRCLDLVITSDTSAAHLAGALGVPVWLALSHVPDWRWCLEWDRCPWYPTMRLFRQPRWHDWPSVFQHMAVELAKRVAGS